MPEKNQNPKAAHLTLTLIFLATTLAIIFLTDPFKSILFVILFFASLAGLCLNFFMLILENVIYKQKAVSQAAVQAEHTVGKIAARQALLLTILVLGLLFLSAQQLLFWWLAAIFMVTLVCIEGFFLVN